VHFLLGVVSCNANAFYLHEKAKRKICFERLQNMFGRPTGKTGKVTTKDNWKQLQSTWDNQCQLN